LLDDLTTAITRLFPGYAGSLGDRVSDGGAVVPDSTIPDSGNTTQTTVPSSVPSSLQSAPELLAQAEVLFDQADAALAQTPPDFATYQSKLSQARRVNSTSSANDWKLSLNGFRGLFLRASLGLGEMQFHNVLAHLQCVSD